MSRIKYNKKKILELKKHFKESSLFPKIICLIVHGSSLFHSLDRKENINSDIDLELVLSETQSGDLETIKNIIDKEERKVECQLRYLDEISEEERLINLSSYKLFMYFAYANGICLLGENVYKDLIEKLSFEQIKESFIVSAQIYFKDIRKSFLRGDSPYWVNKNIVYTLEDLCFASGLVNYKKLGKKELIEREKNGFVDLIINEYGGKLKDKDKNILREFSLKNKKDKICSGIFSVVKRVVSMFEKDLSA